jgi:hypothetical protein
VPGTSSGRVGEEHGGERVIGDVAAQRPQRDAARHPKRKALFESLQQVERLDRKM